MKRKNKFNQDEFAWTLDSFINSIRKSNDLKEEELEQERELKERELAVKDRVDLSLKEYKELLAKIERIENDNKCYQQVWKDLHIEEFLHIMDFKSIEVHVIREDIELKNKVRICFDTKIDF